MASNMLTNLRGPDPNANRQTDAISRLVEPVAKAVMATPIMGANPPAWIRPPLQSGFLDFGAGWAPMRYHRDALGYVHAQGFVANSIGVLIPGASTIARFAIGYRPALNLDFVCDSTAGFASVLLYSDGRLVNAQAVGAGWSLAFNFSFLAEQ